MKKKFAEELIAFALKQVEHGNQVAEVISKKGMTLNRIQCGALKSES